MIVIPIRTDRQQHHIPWVNYFLIGVNVAVYLATREQILQVGALSYQQVSPEMIFKNVEIYKYYLHPEFPQLHQFISYQFLHGGLMHLLGNMLFLYVFGNALEDRLGKVGYLAFYLAGGVMAGLAHALTDSVPVLGASGSVSAVTGAYLALFPKVVVTIFYWFYWYIGTFEVSSMLLIGFQIVQNILFELIGDKGVAYLAHLGGYGYGLMLGMFLLWIRLLPREPYDLLAMIKQRRRRSRFLAMAADGYLPWGRSKAAVDLAKAGSEPPLSANDLRISELRKQIGDALGRHDLDRAAWRYGELLDLDPNQMLSQTQQMDLSNYLMAQGQYELAARAYELFLATYKGYPHREQIQLILGLIYGRYLKRYERGAELLSAALPRLDDPNQQAMARNLLKDIGPSDQ